MAARTSPQKTIDLVIAGLGTLLVIVAAIRSRVQARHQSRPRPRAARGPHQMAKRMWLPMLVMGPMALVVGLVLGVAREAHADADGR